MESIIFTLIESACLMVAGCAGGIALISLGGIAQVFYDDRKR